MEPYLPDGSVALAVRGQIEDGEVGVFVLDGEMFCKQFCMDHMGNIYLFSLNRARSDADQTIWHDSNRGLYYVGKVLMGSGAAAMSAPVAGGETAFLQKKNGLPKERQTVL